MVKFLGRELIYIYLPLHPAPFAIHIFEELYGC